LIVTAAAQADTLPIGAIAVSGSFIANQGIVEAYPIEVPKGMVFVLTDVSFARGAGDIDLFAPEDLTNPRFSFYRDLPGAGIVHAFQTGLVFFGAPSVRARQGDLSGRARVSFSGYFLPASP
jgi:hypothetical protein